MYARFIDQERKDEFFKSSDLRAWLGSFVEELVMEEGWVGDVCICTAIREFSTVHKSKSWNLTGVSG